MGLFRKKINFVSAICPNCKGNLKLDTKLERAICQHCGAESIIENTPKQQKQQGRLELVLDFIERQQEVRRQDKKERQIKKEELKKEQEKQERRTTWIAVLLLGVTLVVCGLMALLNN